MEYEIVTTVEMSENWNITSQRLGVICSNRHIRAAIKKGKEWLNLTDTLKAADVRYKKNHE